MAEEEVVAKLKGDSSDFDQTVEGSGEKLLGFNKKGLMAAAGLASVGTGINKVLDSTLDMRQSLGRTTLSMDTNRRETRGLAADLQNATFPMDDVVATMDLLSRQGIKSADDMRKTANAADTLADATDTTAESVAKNVVPALRVFGHEATDLPDHIDTFAVVVRNTSLDLEEFSGIIERLAPELQDLGLDIDDVAAIMLGLDEKGVVGRKAITEFRTVVNELEADLADAKKELDELTQALDDLGDQSQGADNDITKFEERVDFFREGSEAAREQLEQLFGQLPNDLQSQLTAQQEAFLRSQEGIRSTEGELDALNRQMEEAEEITPEMARQQVELEQALKGHQEAAREAERGLQGLVREAERSDGVNQNLAGSLDNTVGSLIDSESGLTDNEGKLRDAQQASEDLADESDNLKDSIAEQEEKVAELSDSEAQMIGRLGISEDKHKDHKKVVDESTGAAEGFAAGNNDALGATDQLSAKMDELNLQMAGLVGPVSLLGPGLQAAGGFALFFSKVSVKSLIPALLGAASAGWAAVAPMLPWLLAILGIAAVVAAVILVIKHWDEILHFLGDTVDWLWAHIKWAWEQVLKFTEQILEKVMDFLEETWEWIVDATVDSFRGLLEFWEEIWETITDTAKALWDGIKDLWKDTVDFIKRIARELFDLWLDANKAVFEAGMKLIQWAWDGMKDMWVKVRDWFKDLPATLRDGFLELAEAAIGWGKDIVLGIWDGIQDRWEWLKGKFTEAWGDLVGGVTTFLGIASPSKLFKWITEKAVEGAELGARGLKGILDPKVIVSDGDPSIGDDFFGGTGDRSLVDPGGFANGGREVHFVGDTIIHVRSNDPKGVRRELEEWDEERRGEQGGLRPGG